MLCIEYVCTMRGISSKSISKCFKYRMYIIHIAIFEYQIYYCDYRLIRC